MGYVNSVAYVQRQIDQILRPFRDYCQAYIDDIVIASKTFEDHLAHLDQIFACLESYNVAIAPHKSFIGYPDVQLLGQRVDAMGLTTTEDKIKAVQELKFPRTLADLESYIGLISCFRQYIHRFAAKIDPLQRRKTLLLKRITGSRTISEDVHGKEIARAAKLGRAPGIPDHSARVYSSVVSLSL